MCAHTTVLESDIHAVVLAQKSWNYMKWLECPVVLDQKSMKLPEIPAVWAHKAMKLQTVWAHKAMKLQQDSVIVLDQKWFMKPWNYHKVLCLLGGSEIQEIAGNSSSSFGSNIHEVTISSCSFGSWIIHEITKASCNSSIVGWGNHGVSMAKAALRSSIFSSETATALSSYDRTPKPLWRAMKEGYKGRGRKTYLRTCPPEASLHPSKRVSTVLSLACLYPQKAKQWRRTEVEHVPPEGGSTTPFLGGIFFPNAFL